MKEGSEGAEELAVTFHVFPPGHASIVTVGVREMTGTNSMFCAAADATI